MPVAIVANNDTYSTPVGTTLRVNVANGLLANDSDPNVTLGSGYGLDVTFPGPSVDPHGALTLQPDGSFVYTPQSGFAGTVVFKYMADEWRSVSGDGTTIHSYTGLVSNIATFTINVGDDHVDLTVPGPITATRGVNKAVSGVAVIDDGLNGETFSVTMADTVGRLSIVQNGVTIIFNNSFTSPNLNLSQVNALLSTLTYNSAIAGNDTITIKVNDSDGDTVTKTVNVTTIADSSVGLAVPGALNVARGLPAALSGVQVVDDALSGETYTVVLSDSMGNLSATGAGVSGSGTHSLTITGALSVVNSDLATLSYNSSAVGTDSISIKVTDSDGSAITRTVSVLAAVTPATVYQEIVGLYVTLYGNAPTGAGIQFWINATSAFDPAVTLANASTLPISTADAKFLGQQFVQTQSTYFQSQYSALDDANFTAALYQNLTNSSGSPAGVQFWLSTLQAEEVSIGSHPGTPTPGLNVLLARANIAGQFVHDVLSIDLSPGAAAFGLTAAQYAALVQGQQAMFNKTTVAQYWATETGLPGGSILNYTTVTDPALAAAQRVLSHITSDPATVDVAIIGINNAVAHQDLHLVV